MFRCHARRSTSSVTAMGVDNVTNNTDVSRGIIVSWRDWFCLFLWLLNRVTLSLWPESSRFLSQPTLQLVEVVLEALTELEDPVRQLWLCSLIEGCTEVNMHSLSNVDVEAADCWVKGYSVSEIGPVFTDLGEARCSLVLAISVGLVKLADRISECFFSDSDSSFCGGFVGCRVSGANRRLRAGPCDIVCVFSSSGVDT